LTKIDISKFTTQNSLREEAIEAMFVLGYNRQTSEKIVAEILKRNPSLQSTEEIIKLALQMIMKQ